MAEKDYPPPPSNEPAPSLYEEFFGKGGTQQPDAAGRAAERLAPPGRNQDPSRPPAAGPERVEFSWLQNQDQPGIQQSQEPEPEPRLQPVKVQLPSGYEVPLSPEEIQRLYKENLELRRQMQEAQAQQQQVQTDPQTPGTQGQPLPEVPQLDEEQLDDTSRALYRALRQSTESLQAVQSRLQQIEQMEQERLQERVLETTASRIEQALDKHPFTAKADQETRQAIAELAVLDVRRYGETEGVTYEMAVEKYANHFEGLRRRSLAETVHNAERMRVPPPPGPGSMVQPPKPPPRDISSGGFARGLRQALQEARRRIGMSQE